MAVPARHAADPADSATSVRWQCWSMTARAAPRRRFVFGPPGGLRCVSGQAGEASLVEIAVRRQDACGRACGNSVTPPAPTQPIISQVLYTLS